MIEILSRNNSLFNQISRLARFFPRPKLNSVLPLAPPEKPILPGHDFLVQTPTEILLYLIEDFLDMRTLVLLASTCRRLRVICTRRLYNTLRPHRPPSVAPFVGGSFVKTLDFSDLGPLLRGSIFRQAIATCSGLRKVNLRNCTAIVDEDIASLVSSTANSRGTLESLDLIGATLLTDKALEFVSQITTLRHLSLERNCLVTDPGLACLASLRCLKFFRCASMPGVSAEGVTTFFSTRSTNGSVPIQRVDLSKTAVNDAALTLIAEQGGHHLECLNLSRAGPCSDLTQPTDASFLILATSCRSIKHLDISYCTQVTGKTVSAICEGFADLLSVNLTGCRGVPVSCLGLMGELRRKYGRLCCLTIGDTPGLSDEMLAEITSNGALLGWHKSAVEEPILRSNLGVGDSWA